jgi:hypothetical protein
MRRTRFGCCCRLGSTDDMISAGLHLTDLNMFDNTSDLLITAMQQERAIEEAIEKVSDSPHSSLLGLDRRTILLLATRMVESIAGNQE